MTRTPTKTTPVTTRRKAQTAQETATKAVSTALAQVSRVVIVNFPSNSQGYSYHTRDESIAVGDYCIVISPYSGRAPWVEGNDHHFREEALGGYPSVVRVVDVKETTHSINKASKWIVQKLDLSVAMAEAEKRQQIQVLTAKISKARKEAEERVKLEQLRELSPELSSLLDQLDALQAG